MLYGIKLRDAFINNGIECESTVQEYPFILNEQLSEDSIDLRLGNYGYIMNNEYEYINTLSSEKFDKYFTKIQLPIQGYILKPNEILFAPTLEKITISNDTYWGHLTGRSVFSRMGLSIHCTQNKFTTGMNSIVPLQIKNENKEISLKIFPFQKIAQLIIQNVDKETGREMIHSESQFANEVEYMLPNVLEKDRIQYKREDVKELFSKDKPGYSISKIENNYTKLCDYLTMNLGEYKTIQITLLTVLVSLIIGLVSLPIMSINIMLLPISSWIIIIIFLIIGITYSSYKYFRIKNILRDYKNGK